ncbi:hypothetical protein SAMN04487948_10925 [Halogranum amylolyticum]|uniref:Uncharacterized protein n=1 Tax=Halogranum amylolyticum TaxID=660520 RepID=A0A1H8U0K3_9EURY|nr:hypothetical protein [Halogranum amylolyticum]SEO96394.1 hypothetical protein SAMN04487948_10925 [Halogranum amylolyticum]
MSFGTPSTPNWRPTRQELLVGAAVVNAELLVVLLYLAFIPVRIQSWRFIAYGFLWINVGLYAVAKTDPAPTDPRTRRIALLVAGGYFLLLAVAGGILGPSHSSPLAALITDGHTHSHTANAAGASFDVRLLVPGWGPSFVYQGGWFLVILMPYKVVGYVALAYLIYATVIDAVTASLSGALGLLSCISCAWPVLGSLVTSVFGSGSAVAVAATTWPYDISTVAFLGAVGLLMWRPVVGDD